MYALIFYFKFQEEQFSFNCTAITLVFRTVEYKIEVIALHWKELSYSLLIALCVLCYRPSRHNGFISLGFASALGRDDNHLAAHNSCTRDIVLFISYKIFIMCP